MSSEAAGSREPLVSIVTPCRGARASLERCLESVQNQEYAHLEHIVIDGASTDGTVELLERSPDIRWTSEPDSGQSEALVKGFGLARGHILTWLNADDELLPGAVRTVVETFSRHPEAGWVCGRAAISGAGRASAIEPMAPIHDRDLQFGNPIVQPSTFFRRTALDQAGQVDQTLNLAMDLDLWLRFINRGIPRVFIPAVLAKMTYGDDSKTASIDRTEFMKENFLVYLKNGWIGPAHLALGSVAAYRAIHGTRIQRNKLRQEADSVTEWARQFHVTLDRRDVQSAATVEACFAEQHLGIRISLTPLRHLASPEAWRFQTARRRIVHGLTRKLLNELSIVGRRKARAAVP